MTEKEIREMIKEKGVDNVDWIDISLDIKNYLKIS